MVFTGRGGFGNHTYKSEVPVQAMPVQHFSAPSQKIRTGRGGFGNTVKVADIVTPSSEDLLAEQRAREIKSSRYYFIGRGGAGNHITPQTSNSTLSSGGASMNPYTSTPANPIRPLTSRIWSKVAPSKTR